MKPKILIFGGGTALSYTIDIIECQRIYEIWGIIDSKAEIGSELCGYRVVGRQENIKDIVYRYDIKGGVCNIGTNYSRKLVVDNIEKEIPDFNWINAIHPSCIISKSAKLGKGILMMAGVIINSNAELGDNSHYYTGCQIEHDAKIGEFASVSAGTVLGGHVNIGKFSAICLNCTIFDRIVIGENSVLGSGSLLTTHLYSNQLWYGNPAKFIRNRELTDKYLK